jgi:peptidoglycan/LPS O-acetylase OafA/YrhL
MLLLAVPFALFVLGNSLQGLLEQRGMKVLGEASFSIYLLHGSVIYLLFSVFSAFDFTTGGVLDYALWLPLVLGLVSTLSVATYWAVERPFLIRRGTAAATQRPHPRP